MPIQSMNDTFAPAHDDGAGLARESFAARGNLPRSAGRNRPPPDSACQGAQAGDSTGCRGAAFVLASASTIETRTNAESEAYGTVLRAIATSLGNSIVTELQPIIDAIAALLREGCGFENRSVSVTLPVVEGQTLVVSVHSAKACLEPPPESPVRGLDARQLQLVNGAIDERIGEPISVSMLSSLAGLSRSHFSQRFRKSVGRTPHEHVVRVRIERAMELMVESDAPLSEIALATGFCDQAHFTNTFRRAAGTTPTQWRKRQRAGWTPIG